MSRRDSANREELVNDEIDADRRVTLLSFNSTGGRMGGIAGLLAGGLIADRAGIPVQWQISSLLCLCSAPFYVLARRRSAECAPAIAAGAESAR